MDTYRSFFTIKPYTCGVDLKMADIQSRSGGTYINPDILDFIQQTHAKHDHALAQAYETPEKAGVPAIQLGPSEAKWLGIMLRLIHARKVIEIGTLVGYSTIHLARALPFDGHVWTFESESRHASLARENIRDAKLSSRVSIFVGAALDMLPSLESYGPFDAVFIDADKINYEHYGRWAARNLRSGGLLLGDNAFLFGNLLDDSLEAKAMRRFHQEVAQHFDSVCVPTPDGMLVGIKR